VIDKAVHVKTGSRRQFQVSCRIEKYCRIIFISNRLLVIYEYVTVVCSIYRSLCEVLWFGWHPDIPKDTHNSDDKEGEVV